MIITINILFLFACSAVMAANDKHRGSQAYETLHNITRPEHHGDDVYTDSSRINERKVTFNNKHSENQTPPFLSSDLDSGGKIADFKDNPEKISDTDNKRFSILRKKREDEDSNSEEENVSTTEHVQSTNGLTGENSDIPTTLGSFVAATRSQNMEDASQSLNLSNRSRVIMSEQNEETTVDITAVLSATIPATTSALLLAHSNPVTVAESAHLSDVTSPAFIFPQGTTMHSDVDNNEYTNTFQDTVTSQHTTLLLDIPSGHHTTMSPDIPSDQYTAMSPDIPSDQHTTMSPDMLSGQHTTMSPGIPSSQHTALSLVTINIQYTDMSADITSNQHTEMSHNIPSSLHTTNSEPRYFSPNVDTSENITRQPDTQQRTLFPSLITSEHSMLAGETFVLNHTTSSTSTVFSPVDLSNSLHTHSPLVINTSVDTTLTSSTMTATSNNESVNINEPIITTMQNQVSLGSAVNVSHHTRVNTSNTQEREVNVSSWHTSTAPTRNLHLVSLLETTTFSAGSSSYSDAQEHTALLTTDDTVQEDSTTTEYTVQEGSTTGIGTTDNTTTVLNSNISVTPTNYVTSFHPSALQVSDGLIDTSRSSRILEPSTTISVSTDPTIDIIEHLSSSSLALLQVSQTSKLDHLRSLYSFHAVEPSALFPNSAHINEEISTSILSSSQLERIAVSRLDFTSVTIENVPTQSVTTEYDNIFMNNTLPFDHLRLYASTVSDAEQTKIVTNSSQTIESSLSYGREYIQVTSASGSLFPHTSIIAESVNFLLVATEDLRATNINSALISSVRPSTLFNVNATSYLYPSEHLVQPSMSVLSSLIENRSLLTLHTIDSMVSMQNDLHYITQTLSKSSQEQSESSPLASSGQSLTSSEVSAGAQLSVTGVTITEITPTILSPKLDDIIQSTMVISARHSLENIQLQTSYDIGSSTLLSTNGLTKSVLTDHLTPTISASTNSVYKSISDTAPTTNYATTPSNNLHSFSTQVLPESSSTHTSTSLIVYTSSGDYVAVTDKTSEPTRVVITPAPRLSNITIQLYYKSDCDLVKSSPYKEELIIKLYKLFYELMQISMQAISIGNPQCDPDHVVINFRDVVRSSLLASLSESVTTTTLTLGPTHSKIAFNITDFKELVSSDHKMPTAADITVIIVAVCICITLVVAGLFIFFKEIYLKKGHKSIHNSTESPLSIKTSAVDLNPEQYTNVEMAEELSADYPYCSPNDAEYSSIENGEVTSFNTLASCSSELGNPTSGDNTAVSSAKVWVHSKKSNKTPKNKSKRPSKYGLVIGLLGYKKRNTPSSEDIHLYAVPHKNDAGAYGDEREIPSYVNSAVASRSSDTGRHTVKSFKDRDETSLEQAGSQDNLLVPGREAHVYNNCSYTQEYLTDHNPVTASFESVHF